MKIYLDSFIRSVPDFPKKGIVFKDITPLLADKDALVAAADQLAEPYKGKGVKIVAGVESRGFILGPMVAERLGAGFVLIRKPGKLPAATISESYELEYGTDTIEIHADAVKPGQKVLMIDDLLATGGTMAAACRLIEKLGGSIVGVAFLIELCFLNGRGKLSDYGVHSLIKIAEEFDGSTAKKYKVHRVSAKPPLTGDVAGTVWQNAEVAKISEFPWYKSGDRQGTEVRVLYDKKAIYLQFICEDKHISSAVTELNGLVCVDSCVEFFASPHPGKLDYFNFEANCCGVVHFGYGPIPKVRNLITPELASKIQIATSINTPTKEESPDDNGWWLAVAIPFDVLREFTGLAEAPKAGTVWRGNFYRCGGKTDDQFACWSPVVYERPNFHAPDQFGELLFD